MDVVAMEQRNDSTDVVRKIRRIVPTPGGTQGKGNLVLGVGNVKFKS